MEELKKRLLATGRELERLGLSTVGPAKGSCSVRDRHTNRVYITPSGKSYRDVGEEELVVTDLDGQLLEGSKPSVDLIFHRAIYRARPETGAVIHLHTPYATAFAILRQEIPVCMQALANTVGDAIPIAGFALPGTDELGANIVAAMKGRINAVLMANHGMVVAAPTPEEALSIAATVELAAQATIAARSIDVPTALTQEEIDGARGFYAKRFFN